MLIVKELTDDLIPLVEKFLYKDPFINAYAIYDLHYLRHRAKFFICLEDYELKGLLLDFLSRTGMHAIWLWGGEEAVEKLLDVISADKIMFHVFPESEHIIKRKFAVNARYDMDFMLLKRGEERLYINHEIRQLSLTDAIHLASLRRDEPTDEDIEEAENFLKELPFYGIFKDGKLVSVACVHVKIPEIWIIGGFYTKPEYRNKGCATSLASFLVREALKSTEHVGLHVRTDNYPAKHVYEKVGFKAYGKMCWLTYNIDLVP
ncbi:MAG: GNAT family N-acetyltransferase [archaeon YNP-LCB-003-016]|uniref:GNAT family N-acetyltransferase n=1 Tax=Candidatus Culexarchaeum yellowstonense TaxID=2928963 RepID=UPI0026E9C46A|nr:GNAT family N-acetyltransferase [Candidatus Culexarchaeum yellowstonense]MCR6692496.1 GNAT family N-acetyltransferase [Candidatus Culexarchaeum yellowstonense]